LSTSNQRSFGKSTELDEEEKSNWGHLSLDMQLCPFSEIKEDAAEELVIGKIN